MANNSAKPKFSLRLLIDEEKNRVVLAEAGKDFVDVLCCLLTPPMGTIVRLLEKHLTPQSSIVGCFHNLYKSVSDMNVDNFETQTCKDLLLYPRSIKEGICRKLKLNIDDTPVTKLFVCQNVILTESCRKAYSNLNTSRCSCGTSMNREIKVQEEEQVFISCRTSFIITDDLKVSLNSIGLVLNVLNDLGYIGFDKLKERVLDVGFEEVLTLLGCLFTSDAPLTDTFLMKDCMSMTRKRRMLAPLLQESNVAEKLITLKVYVRKTDKAVIYAECREDFVDFLLSFLAIPLEYAWELSIDNINMGCVGNLCTSVKGLSSEKQTEATASKCMLPSCYNFRAQLLDIVIQDEKVSEFECFVPHNADYPSQCSFSRKIKKDVLSNGERILKFTPLDKTSNYGGVGFVKGETRFLVSDDLFITPMNSSSTISLLSKLQLKISEIDEQVINISKTEAVSLLSASLITTYALTNGLSCFITKKKESEPTKRKSKIPKSEKTI